MTADDHKPERTGHPRMTTKPLPFGCARCATRWKGQETCHCGKCHQTFAYIGSFEHHQCGVPARISRSDRRMTGVAA